MNYIKPKLLLWANACIILVAGIIYAIFAGAGKVFDIRLLDTYYVIGNLHLTIFLTFVNFMLGTGYHYFERMGRKTNLLLTRLHTAITIICSLTCWITAFTLSRSGNIGNKDLAMVFAAFLAIFLAVQAIYFINLFSAALKR